MTDRTITQRISFLGRLITGVVFFSALFFLSLSDRTTLVYAQDSGSGSLATRECIYTGNLDVFTGDELIFVVDLYYGGTGAGNALGLTGGGVLTGMYRLSLENATLESHLQQYNTGAAVTGFAVISIPNVGSGGLRAEQYWGDQGTSGYFSAFNQSCSVCGNGIREELEQCDDGNNDEGDGCDSICHIEGAESLETGYCTYTDTQQSDYYVYDIYYGSTGDSSRLELQWGTFTGNSGYYLIWNNGAELETDLQAMFSGALVSGYEGGDDSFVSIIFSGVTNTGMRISRTRTNDGWTGVVVPFEQVCSEICGNGAIEGNEACDDGNTTSGDGCSAICQVESGRECSGTPSSCDGICGDEILTGSETCDFGSNNGTGAICSAICQYQAPSCSLSISSASGTAELSVGVTVTAGTGAEFAWIDFGTGAGQYTGVSSGQNIYTGLYSLSGSYTINFQVSNPYSGSLTSQCSGETQIFGLTGSCGSALLQYYYTGSSPTTGELCATGSSLTGSLDFSGSLYSGDGGRIRSCVGDYGGSSIDCSAFNSSCGDGIVGTGVGYGDEEECDDNNTSNGDGCSSTCQFETPYCNLQATPATGEAPLYVTVDETSGQSWISYTALDWDDGDIVSNPSFATSHILTLAQQYVVTLTVQNNRTGSSSTGACQVNVQVETACGNNLLEAGEECDDGNTTPGDGCDEVCLYETPECLLTVDPDPSYSGNEVTYTLSLSGWIDNSNGRVNFSGLDFGDGAGTGLSTGGSYTHTYSSGDMYTGVATLTNTDSGSIVASCLTTLNVGWCGDSTTNGTGASLEACDDGNISNGDGCSSACSFESLACTLDIVPSSGTAITSVGIFVTGSSASRAEYDFINYGTGGGEDANVSSGQQVYTGTYELSGLYTITFQLSHPYSGSITSQCTGQTQIFGLTGNCGSALLQYYYTGSSPTTGDLCATGASLTGSLEFSGSLYSGDGGWTRSCIGDYDGSSIDCSALNSYCGDGIVGTGAGSTGAAEQCDDGNNNEGDGCYTCRWEVPSCTLTASPNPVYSGTNTTFSISPTTPTNTGRIAFDSLTFGDSSSATGLSTGDLTYDHAYTIGGLYTGTLRMYNIYNPDTLIACRKAVDVDWCGDVGVYTGRETCDGANLAGRSCQTEGYVSGSLSCYGSCVVNTESCIDVLDPVVTKAAEPPISGSLGYFVVTGTRNSVVTGTSLTLEDEITPVSSGDMVTGVTILFSSGIASTGCGLVGTTGVSCAPTLDYYPVGGILVLRVAVYFHHGGDEPIVNNVEICANATCDTANASLDGYNLSVQKVVLTGYDSGYGEVAINTYPSSNYLSGVIDDGDWIVYDISFQNDGPQDAWSPVFSDQLPTGMTLVDVLTEIDNTSATLSGLSRAVGGTGVVATFSGKFYSGDSYLLEFSAVFDATGYASGAAICNVLVVSGASDNQYEESTSNNSTGVCLDALACGIRSCTAEIYGTDFEETASQAPSSTTGNYTLQGRCIVEGNCGLSDRMQTSVVDLTYTTCTGSYLVSGTDVVTTTIHSGQAYNDTSTPVGTIQAHISGLLLARFTTGSYEWANISSLSVTSYPTTGSFTYECRYGNPYLTCEKATCSDDFTLSQSRTIGSGAWVSYGSLSAPATGSQATAGIGELTGFYCDTCGDGVPGGDDAGQCGLTTSYYTGLGSPNSGNGCLQGTFTGLATTSTGRSRQCIGTGGTELCAADLLRCGDGTRNGVEQCDLGIGATGNDTNNGCTSTCTLQTPLCNFYVSPTSGTAALSVTGYETSGAALSGWIEYVSLDRNDGTIFYTGAISFPTGNTYMASGSYHPVLVVQNNLSGSIGGPVYSSCTGLVEVDTECGNGILEAGEQCDDGNIISADGCDSICVREAPECVLSVSPNPGYSGNEVTFTLSLSGWIDNDGGWVIFSGLDFGDGTGVDLSTGGEYTHMYTSGGSYIGTATIYHNDSGSIVTTCSTSLPIGRCGDATINGSGGQEQCDGSELSGAVCSDVGYPTGTLGCNSICVYDTSGCDETTTIDVTKTGLGIIGSTGSFQIDVTRGAVATGVTGSFVDTIAPVNLEDAIVNRSTSGAQDVTGFDGCALIPGPTTGLSLECYDLQFTDPLNGASVTFFITVYLDQGGDDTLRNTGVACAGNFCGTGSDNLEGYNLSVYKLALTGYDSGFGESGFNTYPSSRILSGFLADGDRVVYSVTFQNDGPEDARSPTETDTLDAGLTIIDFLTGVSDTTAALSGLTRSVGGTSIVASFSGKFYTGDSYTFEFSALFEGSGYSEGQDICNRVVGSGQNASNEQTPANNSTGFCLEIPLCEDASCQAEIYGIDMLDITSISGPSHGQNIGTYAMTGRCEVEGTCGISDKFTGSAIDLTYEVCTGSYSVGGGVIVVNTVYSGTLLNSGGTYAGNTGTAISSVLGELFVNYDTTYLWADSGSVTVDTSTDFSYICRTGNPYFSCSQTSCVSGVNLDQTRTIGGNGWAELDALTDDKPADGEQAPVGNGEFEGYICNTCNGPGGGGSTDGVCSGGVASATYYSGVSFTPSCDQGSVTGTATSGAATSWQCVGLSGGTTMECDATLLRCGDDIISSPQEECEGSNFNGETCQSQGYTAGDLVCVACQIDTSDCTDPSPPDVVKDNELILGSTGSFLVTVNWGWAVDDITFTDTIAPANDGDRIVSYQVVQAEGISYSSFTFNDTELSAQNLSLDDPDVGGTLIIRIYVYLTQGGDDTLRNTGTACAGLLCDSDNADLKGYNISVDKVVLTGYDSLFGLTGFNSYPSGHILSGYLYDGDRVVYRVTMTNDGPQDAWSPTIADDLDPGITIIDFLTGYGGTTAELSGLTRSVGGTSIDIALSGKFYSGDRYILEFSAVFNGSGYASGSQICNLVESRGENVSNELTPIDNEDQVCLLVPPCVVQTCVGEIYGIDFTGETSLGSTFNGVQLGTYTGSGRCEIEATCQMSDKFATDVVALNYTTCTGSYIIGATAVISTNYSGTIYTGSATPILGDTTGSVATALDDALNDGYDRAHTGSVVIDGDSVNGTFEYVCRIGDPYLECTQSDSCSESNYLQQSRTIAGDTWTDLDSITLPTEGTQGSGVGFIGGFSCNTCDGDGGGTGTNGECGTTTYYSGSTPSAASGCTAGIFINLTQTSTGWIWECVGLSGGTSVSCSGNTPYCGDSTVFTGQESCDDGNILTGDGCDETCAFEDPWCLLTLTPTTGSVPLYVTGTITGSSRTTYLSLDRDDGTVVADPTFPTGHLYTATGGYTVVVSIGSSVTGATLTGSCTGFVQASVECGNSVLELGEECDDGNTTGGDGCGATCLIETPSCTLSADPSSRYSGQVVTFTIDTNTGAVGFSGLTYGDGTSEGSLDTGQLNYTHVYSSGGSYIAILTVYSIYNSGLTAICQTTGAAGRCGDEIVNDGESCDGSALSGQSCTSLGYATGTLSCTSSCTFDTAECIACSGDSCTFTKQILSVTGDYISYEIAGYMDSGVDVITMIDTLSGATHVSGSFILTTSGGSASLDSIISGNTATLTLTKTSGTLLTFVITYSGTTTWTYTGNVPIAVCNAVVFSGGGIQLGTGSACTCPEDWIYNSSTEVCEGGDYTKTLVSTSGTQLNYRLAGFISSGSTGLTIIDTITGAAYDSGSFVLVATGGTITLSTGINSNTVTLTLTKTSGGFVTFDITYTATATWSYSGSVPTAICNEVIFSSGITQVGSDDTCTCPDGRIYCSIDGSCTPEDLPCGFDKRITSISGNTISYIIEGYVDTGDTEVIIIDVNTGGVYNDDFLLTATLGSGSLVASEITGTSVNDRQLTVTKTGVGLFIFEITYTVVASGAYRTGDQIPICNAITLSTDTLDLATDSICGCPDGYTYCPVDGACLLESAICGFDKQLTLVSGNQLYYTLQGYLDTGVTQVSFVDSISGAVYNDDFVLTASIGSGDLTSVITGTDLTLLVDKVGVGFVVFEIEYTATANRLSGSIVPICNDITFMIGTTQQGTEEVCGCPSELSYCSITGLCQSEGESCGYDKTITSTSGSTIFYEINAYLDTGMITLTIVDTISGAIYNDDFVITFDTGTGSLASSISGSSVTLIVTNGGTGFGLFSITYTATLTGGRTYQLCGMGYYAPVEVCNDIVFLSGGTTQIAQDAECACPTGWDYCPELQMCIPTGSPCAVSNSICYDLTMVPTSSSSGTLTTSYTCVGSGSDYLLYVYSGTQLVTSAAGQSGQVVVVGSGSYTALCLVDGDTGVRCGNGWLDCDQIESLANTIGNSLAQQTGYLAEVSRAGLSNYLVCSDYVNLSLDALTAQLETDVYTYFIVEMIALYPPMTGSSNPSVEITELQEAQAIIEQIVESVIGLSCTESCSQSLVISGSSSTGSLCQSLSTSDQTSVSATTHSVDFTCTTAVEGTGLAMTIGCGNSSGTVITGSSIGFGSGVYGMTGTCTYVGHGNYTAQCTVVGSSSSQCQQEISLTAGGCPSCNGPMCGNGIVETGEECDDGNTNNSDACKNNCTVPGGGGGSVCGNGIVETGEECDDGNTNNSDACKNNCTVPGDSGGSVCGNGIVEAGEACDDGNTNDSDACKNNCTVPGGDGGGGGRLPSTCEKGGFIDAKYCVQSEPKCAEIDPPSVMIGEYLPFRRDLELGSEVDLSASTCTDIDSSKKIPGGSLKCTFELYNGYSQQPVARLEDLPCMDDKRSDSDVSLFNELKPTASPTRMGSSWLQLTDIVTKGIAGEYQLMLSKVEYISCEGSSSIPRTYQGVSDERVCAMNIGIGKPYLIHQGASFSTLQDTDLSDLRYIDGRTVLSRDTLRTIQQSSTASYPGDDVAYIISSYVTTQINRAVNNAQLLELTTAYLKKVPNEKVYIYDGGALREPLTIRGGSTSMQPVTLIVRNADLVIEGSLRGKNMYLVPDGMIKFVSTNCDVQDYVEGILMTVDGFSATRIRNDNLSSQQRCDDGRLIVDGLAIGPGLDFDLVQARRARLYDRFNIADVLQNQKVFEGASILLRTNPALRSNLPPGADGFLRDIQLVR